MHIFKLILVVLLCQAVYLVQVDSFHHQTATFCWKDTYGRGVGTIPSDCRGKQKIGLLCYDLCPKGFKRWGFDCHQLCPAGFTNEGLFCRHTQYGRGVGYPWQFGDPLNDKNMFLRCQKDHGKGHCQKYGLIVYPKCKPGYHSLGCCICRPAVPNCQALGMNFGIDLSCAKKIIIGNPHTAHCPWGKVQDAGLCYPPCRKGYSGVGPVCWGDTPAGWTSCGMGAAKDLGTCLSTVFNEISSVGQLALNIITFGTSGGATVAEKVATEGAKFAQMKAEFQNLLKAFQSSEGIAKILDVAKNMKATAELAKQGIQLTVNAGKLVNEIKNFDPKKITAADIIRISSQIAALVDPTGIASTVASFSYPKCSALFGPPGKPSGKTGSSSSPLVTKTSTKVTALQNPKLALKLHIPVLKEPIFALKATPIPITNIQSKKTLQSTDSNDSSKKTQNDENEDEQNNEDNQE